MWVGLGCVTRAVLFAPSDDTSLPATPPGSSPAPLSDGLDGVSDLWADLSPEVGTVVRVGWTQDGEADAYVEFQFADEAWWRTPSRRLAAGAHEDRLLGVPYGETVNWRLVVQGQAGTTHSIATDDAPSKLPVAELEQSDPALQDASLRFLYLSLSEDEGFTARWWVVLVDRAGRAVWARRSDLRRVSLHPRLSWDGRTLLMDQNSYFGAFDGGAESVVERLDVDGTVLQTIDLPGLHHPFQEMPDGRFAYAHMYGPYADDTIDLVDADGQRAELFSCADFLDAIGQVGFCGSNTLNYDAARDSFLYSFYSVDSVVEVDATSGEARRWWGHIVDAWRFDPDESAFWWQHGPTWTADGTLLLSTRVSAEGEETVVREYTLDEVGGRLVLSWSFGEGRGLYGAEMGEAHRLPGGNTLHNYGTFAHLIEATPEGAIAWELDWGSGQDLGRSTPIEDLYGLSAPIF